MSTARLVVVGTGIQTAAQISPAAAAEVSRAEALLFLTNDVASAAWLMAANPSAQSLHRFYAPGKLRSDTYEEIVEHVLSHVRAGKRVCFAVYGHPGVFSYATHESIRRARADGYEARMLPAISAEDCLFADLGIDPGDDGCQSYDATDFLVHNRRVDVTGGLVLWQVGVVGGFGHRSDVNRSAVEALSDALAGWYGAAHEALLYEAGPHPVIVPAIRKIAVGALRSAELAAMSTLYVPPLHPPEVDWEVVRRLGLEREVAEAVGAMSS